MRDNTASSKDLFMSVLSLQPQMKKHILGNGKKYQPLVAELLKSKYDIEDSPIPSSKEMATKLGINSNVLKTWLVRLHADLWELLCDKAEAKLAFGDVDCWLNASYFKNFLRFRAKLPYVPRIGDNISLPFARAKMLGNEIFFVKRVDFVLDSSQPYFEIQLAGGHFNFYNWAEDDKLFATDMWEWKKRHLGT